MIRHALAEGWLVVRQRALISVLLALALAVPLVLAGIMISVRGWLGPAVGSGARESIVVVLLHPRLDSAQRRTWIEETGREHPEWAIVEVDPEDLVDRLQRWFPYLKDLVEDDDTALPRLLEITTSAPEVVGQLEATDDVLAVGPRSSIQQLVGRAVRRLAVALALIGGALLAAAVVLNAVWVHLELYRHADEITIMRLVGATESTIRGPFIVAVTMPGFIAGGLAIVGTLTICRWLSSLAGTLGLPPIATSNAVFGAQALVGVVLPILAATITLARHAADEFDGA